MRAPDRTLIGAAQFLMNPSNLKIPIGQTVVLGNPAIDRDHAVILVTRPEVLASAPAGKED